MKRIPLFMFIFLSIFSITMGTLLFIYITLKQNYLSYQDNLLNTTISQINQTIIEKSTQYLMPATILVETSSQFAKNSVIDMGNKNQIEKYLQSQLSIFPQLSKLYFGTKNGEFIMAYKNENNSLSTKRTYSSSEYSSIKNYNILGQFLNETKQKDSFDPRTRDWYLGAKASERHYWTDLYIFYTGKRPGITSSYPVYNSKGEFEGVFGVDIELSKISDFLSVQKKRYNSTVMILNNKNQIVAQPDSVGFITLDNGNVEPLKVDDLDNKLVKKVIKSFKKNNQNEFRLSFSNNDYLVSFIKFPEYFGKNWKLLTIVPEKKLIQKKLTFRLNLTVLIVIFSLLSFLVSLWLSWLVTKPLKQITFDIERLTYGNIQNHIKNSFVSEINDLKTKYLNFKQSFLNK